MTKIKFCGLRRPADIEAANELRPDYVGFVFFRGSRRFLSFEDAAALRRSLDPAIPAVGVFLGENPEVIASLLARGVIDIAQLHGKEDGPCLRKLKTLTDKPLIRAFRIEKEEDLLPAEESDADFVLLDAGIGGGLPFDWRLAEKMRRPYFLAGGLTPENVAEAIAACSPFAVDVSSGIETDGGKDREKMAAFLRAVKEADAARLARNGE